LNRLTSAPRKKLLTLEGGEGQGDPCEAMSHHGFKGIEPEDAPREGGG
jgi:hypothetical protein